MTVVATVSTGSLVSPFVPAGGVLLLLLAAGLLLWAFGGRLLRPGLAIIGLLAGIPAGLWLGAVAAPEVPPAFFAAGGALAGLVIACVSYLVALASVTAALAGVVALLGAWSAADLGFIDAGAASNRIESATEALTAPHDSPIAREALTQIWLATKGSGASSGTVALRDDGEEGQAKTGVLVRLVDATRQTWEEMPPPRRTLLSASLATGLVIGLLFGLLFADAAGKLVTSLAGSLLLLVAGMPLLSAALGRSEDLLPPRPASWFAALGLLTIIGFGVQRVTGAPPRRESKRDQ